MLVTLHFSPVCCTFTCFFLIAHGTHLKPLGVRHFAYCLQNLINWINHREIWNKEQLYLLIFFNILISQKKLNSQASSLISLETPSGFLTCQSHPFYLVLFTFTMHRSLLLALTCAGRVAVLFLIIVKNTQV